MTPADARWLRLKKSIHNELNKRAEITPSYIGYVKGLEKALKLIDESRAPETKR